MDFVDLLKRPEGKTLEFKRDLSSPDGVLRSIVAFANTAGGTLLLGVEDKTRHVRGVQNPLAMEERLANVISDSVLPRLVPELEILPWRRTHVLAVQVYPSPSRPHYLKRAGLDAGVYVRVGSSNRRADRDMIEELRRFARGEAYDEQTMPEFDSEALDFRVASESFAPVRRLGRADLETLRLVAKHQGRKVPTVGGMLLFGKQRERLFPVPGFRPVVSAGWTRRTSPTACKSRAIRYKPWKKPSLLSKSTPCAGWRSARYVARNAGICRRRRYARQSSTP